MERFESLESDCSAIQERTNCTRESARKELLGEGSGEVQRPFWRIDDKARAAGGKNDNTSFRGAANPPFCTMLTSIRLLGRSIPSFGDVERPIFHGEERRPTCFDSPEDASLVFYSSSSPLSAWRTSSGRERAGDSATLGRVRAKAEGERSLSRCKGAGEQGSKRYSSTTLAALFSYPHREES